MTMLTPRTVTEPNPVASDDDDDLDHIVCCNPNRAMCGRDVTDLDWVDDDDSVDECVVCADLWEVLPTCGEPLCKARRWLRERWPR